MGIAARIGLVAADDTAADAAGQSATVRRVRRTAGITRVGAPVPAGSPLIVQVSRWDPLKDPIGVMEAFVRLDLDRHDCHLALGRPGRFGRQ